MGLAAFDAAYSMAPYVIGPDQALVISGRWPTCRSAMSVSGLDTSDLRLRQSPDRSQPQADAARGRWLLSHGDRPSGSGRAELLDSEGRPFGLVFWRFFLPEGEIETPKATVVPFSKSRGNEARRSQDDLEVQS